MGIKKEGEEPIEDGQDPSITVFLILHGQSIIDSVAAIMDGAGVKYEKSGEGLETKFRFETNRGLVTLRLHNTFMEIATIDRDETPMVFDERLLDDNYAIEKTASVIDTKLAMLSALLDGPSVEAAVEKMLKMAGGNVERVRILRIDRREKGGERSGTGRV